MCARLLVAALAAVHTSALNEEALKARWPLRQWKAFQTKLTVHEIESDMQKWWLHELSEDGNWAKTEGAHCTWGRKPNPEGGNDVSIQSHKKLSVPDGTIFDSYFRPPQPVPPPVGSWDDASVYLGISAYRDGVRCGHTLFEAFAKAYNPERVHVGVVDQFAPGEPRCVQVYCDLMARSRKVEEPWDLGYGMDVQQRLSTARGGGLRADGSCPHLERITVQSMDFREAKGPVYARHLQQELVGEQEFCMQVDAHSILREWWDRSSVAQWLQTENENAVLSHYPWNVSEYRGTLFNSQVPHLCMSDWGYSEETQFVRNWDAEFCNALSRPKLNTLLGAGLVFSKCHADKLVQNDPTWRQVFYAEEFGRAARLFTHGYDMYTPVRSVVWHDYRPNPYAKPWIHENEAIIADDPTRQERLQREKTAAHLRIKTLFHIHIAAEDLPVGSRTDFEVARRAAVEEKMHAEPTLGSATKAAAPDWEDHFLPALGKYGFGSKRTFKQLLKFAGLNPDKHTRSNGEQCGDLTWVPYPGARVVAPEATVGVGVGDSGTGGAARLRASKNAKKAKASASAKKALNSIVAGASHAQAKQVAGDSTLQLQAVAAAGAQPPGVAFLSAAAVLGLALGSVLTRRAVRVQKLS